MDQKQQFEFILFEIKVLQKKQTKIAGWLAGWLSEQRNEVGEVYYN